MSQEEQKGPSAPEAQVQETVQEAEVQQEEQVTKRREPFSKKSMIKLTDFGTTRKQPWWEKCPGELPPFRRDFYTAAKLAAAQAKGETPAEVDSSGVPEPATEFADACLPRYLLEQLTAEGLTAPTPIQQKALPAILSGRDLVGIAATGSGKTLAFVLPAIIHVNDQPLLQPGDGPVVLILTPTRELCIQVEAECKKFAAKCQIASMACYGGVTRDYQIAPLEEGVEILIATPGRLIDFMDTNVTNMRRVTYLVLDEADRMLDMGFEQQLRRIVKHVRPDRQTLMFSATWPKEVEALSREYCCNIQTPIKIQIGEKVVGANPCIKQRVFCVRDEEKYTRFVELLQQLQSEGGQPRTLVFVQTRRNVDYLVKVLNAEHLKGVKGIHGDKNQAVRENLIKEFKQGRTCSVLIATDVASRGLHIDDIQYVINYDMPFQLEDYVHRVGRTARAGNQGTAFTFFTKKNFMSAPDLIKCLQKQDDKTIEMPEQLTQYAFLALKATCRDNNHFKRRWRQVSGNTDAATTAAAAGSNPDNPTIQTRPSKRKTVNVTELIRMKKEAAAAAAAKGTEGAAVPTIDEAPVVKFSSQYFEQNESKAVKLTFGVEEPVPKAVVQAPPAKVLAATDGGQGPPTTEAKPLQAWPTEEAKEPAANTNVAAATAAAATGTEVNPVYKKKWGAKK